MQGPFLDEARHLADLLAGKTDPQLLGKTEFEVRDLVNRLKAEGGRSVLRALQELDLRGGSGAARSVYTEVVMYFGNQVHRMDYPSNVAKGWQIGSGPVESGCKTVVG